MQPKVKYWMCFNPLLQSRI